MKALILLLALPFHASASISDPKGVVEEIFARASVPEITSDDEQQRLVSSYVDFQALASAALGTERKRVAPKDFDWFRLTLQEIITRTVYPKAPEFLSGVKIQYDAVEP